MKTKKRYFVVSDVHGFYSRMAEALEEAGFDPFNGNHIFVSCGDLFDRGTENADILDYVRRLPRKILIKGNHEDITARTVRDGKLDPYYDGNGTIETLAELMGTGTERVEALLSGDERPETISRLSDLIGGMLDYYETDRYIFTHGWLPLSYGGVKPGLRDGWRTAESSEWDEARWVEWNNPYALGLTVPGKTIVCGHRPAALGRYFDFSREPDDSTPFIGNGVAAIDALTVRSGRVNVMIVEDTTPETRLYEMKLNDIPFELMKRGEKTVEMRLYDEKRRLLKPGDKIAFTRRAHPDDVLLAAVTGLYRYQSFTELAYDFTPRQLGVYGMTPEQTGQLMRRIYSDEETEANGAVAIRIHLE